MQEFCHHRGVTCFLPQQAGKKTEEEIKRQEQEVGMETKRERERKH